MNFTEMPTAVKGGALAAGGGVLGASVMVLRDGSLPWYWILLFAVVTVALVVLLMWWVVGYVESKRAAALDRDLGEAVKGGEGSKAQQEHLRRSFQQGIQQYGSKTKGKGIYEIPWFLVMGHPGSGKTFAVQNSGIFGGARGEPVQGAGGTITMDWWFAKEAILLDTAGRFVEGARDDAAEQSRRRQAATAQLGSLLQLLRRHRRDCPINGLVLVIAATDLLTENKDRAIERAKDLASTLATVQRELDVRFPVIVWVTKCDKISGFRQYYRAWRDDEGQRQQMFGWSNPSTDFNQSEFRVEDLKQSLKQLGRQLRERRWQLLRGLRVGEGETRTGAASSLFGFPAEFEQVVDPLASYLKTVFEESDDNTKPPYFRGVYFTSAITEGEELDRQFAEITKRSLRSLFEDEEERKRNHQPVFVDERSYFIRDTLVEKLFKERNLVSRYSNAVTALRRTQWILMGCSALVFALMLGWAWFAQQQLRAAVGLQSVRWENLRTRVEAARERSEPTKEEALRLVRRLPDGTIGYRGQEEIEMLVSERDADGKWGRGRGMREPLLSFYDSLLQQSGEEVGRSGLFRIFPSPPIDRSIRGELWRRAFYLYCVSNVLSEAATEIGREWPTNAGPAVLEALVRWEAIALSSADASFLSEGGVSRVADPLLRFLAELAAPAGGADVHPANHADDSAKFDRMLRAWVQQTKDAAFASRGSTLVANAGVSNAIAAFGRSMDREVLDSTNELRAFDSLGKSIGMLKSSANEWGTKAGRLSISGRLGDEDVKKMAELGEKFRAYRQAHDKVVQDWSMVRRSSAEGSGASNLLEQLRLRLERQSSARFQEISNRMAGIGARLAGEGGRGLTLPRDVADYGRSMVDRAWSPLDLMVRQLRKPMADADEGALAPIQGTTNRAMVHFANYAEAIRLWDLNAFRDLDGSSGYEELRRACIDLTNRVYLFGESTKFREDNAMGNAIANLVRGAWSYQTNRMGTALMERFLGYLTNNLRFPLNMQDSRPALSPLELAKVGEQLKSHQAQLANFGRSVPELEEHLRWIRALIDPGLEEGRARRIVIHPYTREELKSAEAPGKARELFGSTDIDVYADTYRMLRHRGGTGFELVNDNAPPWIDDLGGEGASLQIAKKTDMVYEPVLDGPEPESWGILRWLHLATRVGNVRWEPKATGTVTGSVAHVRLMAPDKKPIAVRVVIDGDEGLVAKRLGAMK